MSFGLALPLGLLALLGLALPLLVHLARREQQQPTMFAALRWLRAARRPRQKLRLEQWLLLALRLLLVAGFALLLAAPWFRPAAEGPARVLVHPSLDAPTVEDGADLRWLAPGFPPVDGPAPAAPVPVASLLRQADAELAPARRLEVHVPASWQGADGERPRLSRPVQWVVAPEPAVASDVEAATDPLVMVVRHGPAMAGQARWLAAAQAAWFASAGRDEARADIAALETPWPADTRLLAWLADGDLPETALAFADEGGTLLLGDAVAWPLPDAGTVAWHGEDGGVRLRAARHGQGRLLRFESALHPTVFPELLEPRFPQWLQAALQAPPPAPTRVRSADHAPTTGVAAFTPPGQPLSPWLAVLLAALFLVERWVAAGQANRRPA